METGNELLAHPWALWSLAALVCAGFEMALPAFVFIFASAGCAAAAIASVWLGPLPQAVTFGVISILGVAIARPVFAKPRAAKHMFQSRADALVGSRGKVIETIEPGRHGGRVEVLGQDWAARSDAMLQAGQLVKVDHSDGIVLIVSAAD